MVRRILQPTKPLHQLDWARRGRRMSNPQTTKGSAVMSWKTRRRSTCMRHRRRRHQRRAAQLKQHQHVQVADPTYQAASKTLGMLHKRGRCERKIRRILEHIHFHFIFLERVRSHFDVVISLLGLPGVCDHVATRLVISCPKHILSQ
jgi:hypothetical protein